MAGGRVSYSSSVDVFSFGVLLSELLSWTLCYTSSHLPTTDGGASDTVDRLVSSAGTLAQPLGTGVITQA